MAGEAGLGGLCAHHALAREPPRAARMVEDIVGCKWPLVVLDPVSRGVVRPGAMQKSVAGLTAKVLNERLRKLTRFGILERELA